MMLPSPTPSAAALDGDRSQQQRDGEGNFHPLEKDISVFLM